MTLEEMVQEAVATMTCPVCGMRLNVQNLSGWEEQIVNVWRHHLTALHSES